MWNGVLMVIHVHKCVDAWGRHQGFSFVALHSMCWGESLNLEFAFLASLAARSLGISSLPSGITGRLLYLLGFFLWVLSIQAPASFLAVKGFAYWVTALALKEPLTSGHRLQCKSVAPEMQWAMQKRKLFIELSQVLMGKLHSACWGHSAQWRTSF